MKVCIYGAGAIGGYMAVLLKRSGVEVSLVARGKHLAAIREHGLKLVIDGKERVERMPATDDPLELGPQDFVVVALKAHQAWEAAERMRPLLGPSTAVVTAQNGVPWWYFYRHGNEFEGTRLASVDPGDRQWNAIGPERVLGCTVYPATEIVAPGVIRHIYGDRFGLGEPNRMFTDRLSRLSQMLRAAGLAPKVYEEIRDDIWIKLWGNLCFNPISVLTNATLDVMATDPGVQTLVRHMMQEAQEIGERFGIRFRVDVERRIAGAASVGAHRTSMLQDFDRKRPLELDALLKAVQEMGRIADVSTPYIDTIWALVEQKARLYGLYPAYPDAELGAPPAGCGRVRPQATAAV